MTEKVWIAIKGVRYMDGQQEKVDETGLGDYYKRNGKHYIIWRYDGNTAKRIKITDKSMTVAETNGDNAMDFEKGRESRTLYGIDGGKLVLEIHTREFCLHEEENLLETEVEYSLYLGCSHISDNHIKVAIGSREA